MKINKISKDIYEIENFVTEDQIRRALDFINSLKEEDWWIENEHADKNSFWYGKQYHGVQADVFEEIFKSVENLFESTYYISGMSVQRVGKQPKMQEHRDYWIYDNPNYVRYGIVIYYNDNYEGGEITYPELGIAHKPKAGSLVMHGGNILHGPSEVTSEDYRYFSTTFVHGNSEMPVILNQELFKDIHEEDGSVYGRA